MPDERITDNRRLEELNDLPTFSDGTTADTIPDQLSVVGSVRSPRVFTLKELQLLPKVSLTKDFQCLEGWTVRGIVWEGIRVTDVLRRVGLTKEARWILFGSGKFTAVIDRETALQANTILAMKKGGKKLTKAHGGPLRLIFAGQQCYESVKCIDRIVTLSKYEEGSARAIVTSRMGDTTTRPDAKKTTAKPIGTLRVSSKNR